MLKTNLKLKKICMTNNKVDGRKLRKKFIKMFSQENKTKIPYIDIFAENNTNYKSRKTLKNYV